MVETVIIFHTRNTKSFQYCLNVNEDVNRHMTLDAGRGVLHFGYKETKRFGNEDHQEGEFWQFDVRLDLKRDAQRIIFFRGKNVIVRSDLLKFIYFLYKVLQEGD
uniref:Uncharacterized protein n=1 Tax=Cacopsylla melanoneura TaxID=428564 RepID=A0A8D8M5F3_9HEMI